MTDKYASTRYAQYLSAMAALEAQMESLEVGDVASTIESVASGAEEQLTSTDEEGDGTSIEDPRIPTDGDGENTSLSTLEGSSDTEGKTVKTAIEEAEVVEEDKYLHTIETMKVILRSGPKPNIFTKGTKTDPIEYTLVDTPELIKFMLDNLLKWRTTGISLFIDLEGKDLGSHTGDVRLMSVYHKSTRHTYLVVVSELEETVFSTTSSNNMSLKNILESRAITKVFWDARNDAAGLHRGFGIAVDGVEDVQLLICRATGFKYDYSRPRLDIAIATLCNMSAEVSTRMKNTKDAGKRMWKPALGGSFAAFSERPLNPKITAYCVSDTYFLDDLYAYGMRQISAEGLREVKDLCWEQLKLTRKRGYRQTGREKGHNPFWIPGDHYDDYED